LCSFKLMNKNNFIQYFFTSLVGLAITAWIVVMIWASNKGFDITDEGLYLYNYSPFNDSKISFTNVHLVQKFLFPFVECSIQNLRIEKLLLSLLAAACFSFSAIYYLKNSLNIFLPTSKILFAYILTVSGFSLTYAFGPQSPSYNFFSSFFITIASSLFIIDLSKKQSTRSVVVIYFLIGLLCEFLFLIKFSNAILLILTVISFSFIYTAIDTKNKFAALKLSVFRLLIIVIGLFITHVIFCRGFNASLQFYKSFFEGINALKGYDSSTLLNTYLASFTAVFNSLCTPKFILLSITLVSLVWAILKKNKLIFYVSLLLQLIVIVKFKLYYSGEINKTEQTITYLLWLVTFLVVFINEQKENKTLKSETFKKQVVFILFLLLMPIAGAIGTNNQLQIQIIFYMPFLIILLCVLIKTNIEQTQSIILCSFISIFAFTQSIDAVIYHPYRINGNLLSQTEALSIGNSETIFVDRQYKENIVEIDSLLKNANYTSNDYLFYYSDLIGLAYLLNHHLPDASNGWFIPNNDEHNCNILSQLHQLKPTAKLYFILDSNDINSEYLITYWTQLKYGATAYHKAGNVNVNFCNTAQVLSIYAPR
jgi:hypothetical protein